jgi:hypothetical protein
MSVRLCAACHNHWSSMVDAILGYLNFSSGKPDAQFARQLDDKIAELAGAGVSDLPGTLKELLAKALADRKAEGGIYREAHQAEQVLELIFSHALPAYRRHHADLLSHRRDSELFTGFFLARIAEAVLSQGPPWSDQERIIHGAIETLNDFTGHRPAAIVEARPRPEPYDHERVRPIPLFIRGAGVAHGPYRDLIAGALGILEKTDPALLSESDLDPKLIDELAIDPRAYDHNHPVNRRPNYVFGEWDPNSLDRDGRYRRLIARQNLIDALMDRLAGAPALLHEQRLLEESAVLAGTLLMATAVSGWGPGAHDSTVSLGTLIPNIARVRDRFYANVLRSIAGALGDTLRKEAAEHGQPFALARRHLNDYLARERARQLQERHLALFFAELGYAEKAEQEAAKVGVRSTLMLTRMWNRLISIRMGVEQDSLDRAVETLEEVRELILRGIDCGALGDPWNILGFQALFPLSPAQADAVRDSRIDDLIMVVDTWFNQCIALVSAAAAIGKRAIVDGAMALLRRQARWWDQFATVEISEVRRVSGQEALASAEHLATALGRWHSRGRSVADMAFWKANLEGFRSPKAFAIVIESLLGREDFVAAMGLLMNWLSHVDQVPLEDHAHSFHVLSIRWMLEVTQGEKPSSPAPMPMVRRFFDYLEANAEEYGESPRWQAGDAEPASSETFEAAYENVTYRDSTDSKEDAVSAGAIDAFPLESEAAAFERRLRFLSTQARLWNIAAFALNQGGDQDPDSSQAAAGWQRTAQRLHEELLAFLNAIQALAVPEPFGSYESMLDYDRRRTMKARLLYAIISASVDLRMASAALAGFIGQAPAAASPGWSNHALRLEQALWHGARKEAQEALHGFMEHFQQEPLLFQALESDGDPALVLRARIAQSVLSALVVNLPRLGLLRETFQVLVMARTMEKRQVMAGRRTSEFGNLFLAGYQAVIESVVDAARAWPALTGGPESIVRILESITSRFLPLWTGYSQTLQLAAIESVRSEKDWAALTAFIKGYGAELFQPRFMTLGNLRGILMQGVPQFLDQLANHPEFHDSKLAAELDSEIDRSTAQNLLEVILRSLIENYDVYKDYNSTTTQSDYGDQLHILLDFLRIKAGYTRNLWQFRPLILCHEILARRGQDEAAETWYKAFARFSRAAAEKLLADLDTVEIRHRMSLRTVRDLIEERFVKPLALDRLCALVGPIAIEAQLPEPRDKLSRFMQLLKPYAEHPVGAGLDVPVWLQALEQEVQRVRAAASPIGVLAETHLRIPRLALSIEQINEQLQNWEAPIM